jgi:hypothetical protein
MRAAAKEQNPLVADGERGPMRDRGCHMPPRLGCALNATEVQSSRRNLNLVYTQVHENTFLIQTLRPIRRRDKYAQQTRRRDARVAPSVPGYGQAVSRTGCMFMHHRARGKRPVLPQTGRWRHSGVSAETLLANA